MRRAQFSIDFFLVLSIVIAFSVLLYTVASSEMGKSTLLDSAVLGKNALDSFSAGADFAAFSGNQSRLNKEVFLPADLNCLFFNASTNSFYCFVSSAYLQGSKNRIVSRPLLSSMRLDLQCTPSQGWNSAQFFNNGSSVIVSCKSI